MTLNEEHDVSSLRVAYWPLASRIGLAVGPIPLVVFVVWAAFRDGQLSQSDVNLILAFGGIWVCAVVAAGIASLIVRTVDVDEWAVETSIRLPNGGSGRVLSSRPLDPTEPVTIVELEPQFSRGRCWVVCLATSPRITIDSSFEESSAIASAEAWTARIRAVENDA